MVVGFIALVLPSYIFASDNTKIKITGQVLENNQPIKGASIVIVGTTKGAISETDGSFVLEVERSKAYKLKVYAIGYQPKEIEYIPENERSQNDLTVRLTPQVNSLADVRVKSNARKAGSVNAVYLAQKNNSGISDGISADVIKKSPDKNTGDVLKRVSGASIQDNKFVIIRGLNERYNTAMLNNAILPSTEPDKRAFAFDIIPASIVDNIVIYKSATPELPGDFAGGAIKITSKEFPTTRLSELSLSIGYNSNTTFKKFNTDGVKGKYDFLGFLDNTRAIPQDYNQNKSNFSNLSAEEKIKITKEFPNDFGYRQVANSLPNLSIAYTNGNTRFLSDSKRLGYIYSIGYGVSRQVADWTVKNFDNNKNILDSIQTEEFTQKYNLNALVNFTYAFNPRNNISWKNLFNNTFASSVGKRNGATYGGGNPYYISAQGKVQQNGIFNSVLGGKNELNEANKIDWNISYSLTYRNEPDERILNLVQKNDGSYFRKVNNENSPVIQDAGRVYSKNHEHLLGATANYTFNFDLLGHTQELKLGAAEYIRLKNVEINALGYATTTIYGAEVPAPINNPFDVFNKENIDQYGLTVANIGNNSVSYKGNARNDAAYAMLNNKFSDKLKLAWGARLENYDQKVTLISGQTVAHNTNLDVLPSGVFTYAVSSKSNIRLGASQSVNRPEFRELVDKNIYDYSTDYIYKGSSDLVRSKNTNADLRYEYFPSSGEIISISVFYKYFKNPIEQINQGNSVLTYQNAQEAKLIGGELEIRKKLDFFNNDLFNHLIAYANLSYVDGNIKLQGFKSNSLMQGQSPYIINAGINYAKNNFSVNILYNRIGPRLAFRGQGQNGMNIYERPRDVLDGQISKKFLKNKRLELKLTISDIMAQPIAWYSKFGTDVNNHSKRFGYNKSTDEIIRQYRLGSTSTLSIKYNF